MRRPSSENPEQRRLLRSYVSTAGTGISRRRAQRTLGAAKIEAELANRAKTEFLASMSHELRTPLNAIIGFADIIAHAPDGMIESGKAREYGTYIAGAGRHLLEVLSDILDIAQIDSGTHKIELAPCDIGRVLELSAACVKERITARHQLLSVMAESALPQLMLDGRRLQQALINLLSNASEFTQEGGCIGLRCTRATTDRIAITVSDNGRGMSAEDLARALAPFAHVQSAYASNSEGISLGLAVAKRLVELQGGSFAIASVLGEGTQVEMTFSLASENFGSAGREREAS